jgi:transposase-like protein
VADLGAGAHTVQEIAERFGATSEQLSSIRNQLVKKDVLFVPNAGMVEFRIPLSDRYVAAHRKDLERRAQAKPPLGREHGL